MSTNNRRILVIGLALTLLVAAGVAQFSSSAPDGLERVAEQEGFAATAQDHDLANSPLADYDTDVTSSSQINTALAAVAGVALTFVIGIGIFWLARRSDRSRPESTAS